MKTRTSIATNLLILAALVSLALSLIACGSGSGTSTPAGPGETITTESQPEPTTTSTTREVYSPTNSSNIYILDTGVSDNWRVQESVELWNTVTDCELFTNEITELQRTVKIVEVNKSNADYWGLGPAYPDYEILLNIAYKPHIHVITHELGHALGLQHNDKADSVMNHNELNTTPSPTDVATVLALNAGHCD